MTWQTYDLEALNQAVRATKRGVGIKVEEPIKRRGYGMGNYVFAPAMAVGFIVYMGILGAGMTILSIIHLVMGSIDNRAWLIVIGLPWIFAARAAYLRFNYQLDEFNELQWTTKRLEVKPGVPVRDHRQIEHVEQGRSVVLQAKWVNSWQADLARRVYNQRGEWIAGDKLTRAILKDLVTDLNNKYSTFVKADLMRLGYINEHHDWQDKAKKDLRDRLRFTTLPQEVRQ